jgi:hypothetical protein
LNFERTSGAVARKKKSTPRWRRTLLVFVITPLVAWFLAFLIWFFWHDMMRLVAPDKTVTSPGSSAPRNQPHPKDQRSQRAEPARENIPDEDRKKLDDILKRR